MNKSKISCRAVAALIALVMALCIFPIATLASANTVAIDKENTTYNMASKEVTLKASISEAGADVTILAIKTNSKTTLADLNAMSNTEIQNSIAYIDQVPAGADGSLTKTFKLRDIAGSRLAIAIGGKGVAVPDFYDMSLLYSPAEIEVADSYIAGSAIEFPITDVNSWIAAADKTVKIDGVPVEAGVTIESGKLKVADPLAFAIDNTVEEKTFVLTIEVPNFTTITKNVKVIAPTKAIYDELAAEGALTVEYEGGDIANGNAFVTLPTATNTYANIAWSVTEDPTAVAASGKMPLARSDAEAKNYTLVATISEAGYKTLTKSYTASVNKLGVAGVDVDITLSFGAAAAANLATVTVDGTAATQNATDKAKFTAAALTPGLHTAVIARPGYATLAVEFTVDESGVIAADAEKVTAVTMFAGDVTGDNKVTLADFNKLKAVFNKTKSALGAEWNDAIDFNGDDKITLADFNMLKANFNRTFPTPGV